MSTTNAPVNAEKIAQKLREIYQDPTQSGMYFVDGKNSFPLDAFDYLCSNEGKTENLLWLSQYPNATRMCEPIDMDFFLGNRNLLAAVVARLQHLLGSHSKTGYEMINTSLHDNLAQFSQSLIHHKLGVGQSYLDTVDPAFGAVETITAEALGLGLVPRFKDIVNKLREYINSQKPLLIIPILNLDSNPDRIMEVLQSLREYSAPGLVYLVTCDLSLVRELGEMMQAPSPGVRRNITREQITRVTSWTQVIQAN